MENVAGLLLDTMKARSRGSRSGPDPYVRQRLISDGPGAESHLGYRCSSQHEGSRAGLSISEALKTFGLVEHSIWVEKETR